MRSTDAAGRPGAVTPHGPGGLPGRRNRFEGRPGLAALALFLLLAAATVAADLVLGALFLPDLPGKKSYFFDHDLKKGYRGGMTYAERRVAFLTNSLGFRDGSNRSVPPATGKRRILFLGDSFTEGVAVPYEATFVGLFQAAVDPAAYDVLNAAVSSYSPKLHYLKLRRLLEDQGLKVDEVVVFIDMSDVQDEVFYERYRPEGAKHPRLYAVLEAIRERSYFVYKADRISGKIARWLRNRFGKRGGPADVGPLGDNAARITFERARWTTSADVFEAWGRKGLGLADAHMDRLVALCRDRGIGVTLAVYPWPENIRAGRGDALQSEHWRAFAASRGLRFLDFFPAFRDAGTPDEVIARYYIPRNMHWNEAGHRLVADVLIADHKRQAAARR